MYSTTAAKARREQYLKMLVAEPRLLGTYEKLSTEVRTVCAYVITTVIE